MRTSHADPFFCVHSFFGTNKNRHTPRMPIEFPMNVWLSLRILSVVSLMFLPFQLHQVQKSIR